MTTNLLEQIAHIISDPARIKAAFAANETQKRVQASMSRWQTAADRASAYQREHRGEPLPSELAGTLSEALGEVEALVNLLEQALGPKLPGQSRAGFDGLRPFASRLRELLGPSAN